MTFDLSNIPTGVSPHSDANFFQAVHRWAEDRSAKRTPYHCMQWVAPCLGKNVPPAKMFKEVECHDLSTAGFSFLAAEPPQHSKLVVALGQREAPQYVQADVVTCSRVDDGPVRRYLVGCHFTRRMGS
jgi:hypothetical protein